MGKLVHTADAHLLKMKLALQLIALAAVSSAASPEDIYKKFLRSLDVYNFRVKCWGEKNVVKLSVGIEKAKKKCMQMVEEDLPRSKRQVEELQEFQQTNEEFILQFGDFQDDLSTTMGNLSCVLKAVQWLNEDGEPNLEQWTTGLIDPPEGGFEFDVEGAAATDLAWREKMSKSATECHELSEAIPAKSLTHDPTTVVLGHAAVFFKCMNKVERRLCAEAEMLEFLEKVYGPTEKEALQELGLPEEKYAAAGIAAAVFANAESPEERFVDEFMWRLDDNL